MKSISCTRSFNHQASLNLTAALSLAAIVPILSFNVAEAAPAKTTKPVVAAKTPAKKTPKLIREVMGTEALVGYEGSLGETFTIGKNSPLNFTLKKAEYSVNRLNVADYPQVPLGDEKLLILRFTVQNPRKTAFNYSASYLNFKAVDSGDVTRTFVGNVCREVTGEGLNITLQPGQKVEAYTALRVAAYGEVPKLIVQSIYEPKEPIVRYDLRGKVAKLVEPFAEPIDASSATARKIVPGKVGAYYPVAEYFDVRVESISYKTELDGRAAPKGKQYCFATVTIRNGSKRPARFSQSHFRADLKDADGEKTNYNASMLKASRDEEAGGELLPGEEAKARFYWLLPVGVKAQNVMLQYGYNREARTFAVDVAEK